MHNGAVLLFELVDGGVRLLFYAGPGNTGASLLFYAILADCSCFLLRYDVQPHGAFRNVLESSRVGQ